MIGYVQFYNQLLARITAGDFVLGIVKAAGHSGCVIAAMRLREGS